jgi:hypothetical protein
MMSIGRRSPFFDAPTHVEAGGQPILVRPFQLVVWVSMQAHDRFSPRVPAILDTGFSLNFAIQEEHVCAGRISPPPTFASSTVRESTGKRCGCMAPESPSIPMCPGTGISFVT